MFEVGKQFFLGFNQLSKHLIEKIKKTTFINPTFYSTYTKRVSYPFRNRVSLNFQNRGAGGIFICISFFITTICLSYLLSNDTISSLLRCSLRTFQTFSVEINNKYLYRVEDVPNIEYFLHFKKNKAQKAYNCKIMVSHWNAAGSWTSLIANKLFFSSRSVG